MSKFKSLLKSHLGEHYDTLSEEVKECIINAMADASKIKDETNSMDYADFISKFKPVKNVLRADAPYGGLMFETFGDELDFVKCYLDSRTIWTIVEVDSIEEEVIIPGYHIVNRLGYLICKIPYEECQSNLVVTFD